MALPKPETKTGPNNDYRSKLAASSGLSIIEPRHDEEGPRPFSLLALGPPGTGKTTLGESFPEPFFLMADTDRNIDEVEAAKMAGMVGIDTYQGWKETILPLIQSRELPGRTLVLDSLTSFAQLVEAKIAGVQSGSRRYLKGFENYNEYKATLIQDLNLLLRHTQPKGSHPGYYIVVPCHLKPEYRKVKVGNEEEMVFDRYVPTIVSDLKNYLGYVFDVVVLCKAGKGKDGQRTWECHAIPSKDYDQLKDRLGYLPATFPNDYSAIHKAWAQWRAASSNEATKK